MIHPYQVVESEEDTYLKNQLYAKKYWIHLK